MQRREQRVVLARSRCVALLLGCHAERVLQDVERADGPLRLRMALQVENEV